ncbi:MAG TPA: DUF166 family protein [Anaerolineales bacterium]|nr:DUF166 family protein [Anaerolineales bacterium]
MTSGPPTGDPFRILAVTQGLWGQRIAANVRRHAPPGWMVEAWAAPARLPPVIDDPSEFLPAFLPQADLLLALGEIPGLGQLLPDIVRSCGATAVIAGVDHTSAMPAGLESQIRSWLGRLGVAVVFPKPLCSLTEESTGVLRRTSAYDDPLIRRFASAFGRPSFRLTVQDGRICDAEVVRDSACGCARHVADNLPGTSVDEAVEKAGMLHHHFPCLASMTQDPDYGDTLMHVSGHQVRDAVRREIESHLAPVPYLRPHGLVEPAPEER